jgi:predicted sulfurtransferase
LSAHCALAGHISQLNEHDLVCSNSPADQNQTAEYVDHESRGDNLVLLDVRNHYETKIGRFQLHDSSGMIVKTAIDPTTRQVS